MVPNVLEQSDIVTITGTREAIEKAEHDIRVISDEQVIIKQFFSFTLSHLFFNSILFCFALQLPVCYTILDSFQGMCLLNRSNASHRCKKMYLIFCSRGKRLSE